MTELNSPQGTPKKILLIDDRFSDRKMAADGLRELGYEVVEFNMKDNTELAELKTIIADQKVDAVLTDLKMYPGRHGMDVVKFLTKEAPHVPVVVHTFSMVSANEHDTLTKAGALDVVEKLTDTEYATKLFEKHFGKVAPHRPKLLIVDDLADDLAKHARVMDAFGYEVVTFQVQTDMILGAIARQVVAHNPDAVLTDWNMHRIQGQNVGRMMKRLCRNELNGKQIPVVLHTTGDEVVEKHAEEWVRDFGLLGVLKKGQYDRAHELIEEALERNGPQPQPTEGVRHGRG